MAKKKATKKTAARTGKSLKSNFKSGCTSCLHNCIILPWLQQGGIKGKTPRTIKSTR